MTVMLFNYPAWVPILGRITRLEKLMDQTQTELTAFKGKLDKVVTDFSKFVTDVKTVTANMQSQIDALKASATPDTLTPESQALLDNLGASLDTLDSTVTAADTALNPAPAPGPTGT